MLTAVNNNDMVLGYAYSGSSNTVLLGNSGFNDGVTAYESKPLPLVINTDIGEVTNIDAKYVNDHGINPVPVNYSTPPVTVNPSVGDQPQQGKQGFSWWWLILLFLICKISKVC